MQQNGVQQWYFSIPPVTRWWITFAVISSLGFRFGFVNPAVLALMYEPSQNYQLWRLLSNFLFFGRPSMSFLVKMMMLYNYSTHLERNPFPGAAGGHLGNQADFVWSLTFCGLILCAIGKFMGAYFLSSSLVFSVIYLWSKRNAGIPASFWGFRFDGFYLPWVLIGFSIIVDDDYVMDLVGLAAAHIYYFCHDILPDLDTPLKGYNLAKTPNFLYKWMDLAPTWVPAAQQAAANRRAGGAENNNRGNWFGGEGRALGRR